MKFQKPFLGITVLCFGLFFTQTHLTSCTKQVINDTVNLTDTLIVKDTVVIRDTLPCNCSTGSLLEGLVGYYNFNGGNLNDSSGYNNHIRYSNAVKAPDFAGTPNNAYLFDGSTTYMAVPNSTSLRPDSLTIVARVKINGFYNGLCHANQIVGKGLNDQVNGVYGLRVLEISNYDCYKPLDVTKQSGYGYANNTPVVAAGAADSSYLSTGQWKTFVFTASRTETRFYTDGVLKSVNAKQTPYTFSANNSDLYFGKMEDPQYPYWFNGVIDEIRIYNRPLCSGEVKLLQTTRN